MRVLWNGVEPKSATVSDEIRAAIAGARGPVIASISTLIPQKGLHHLLDAAHRLQRDGREFLLLVVGDGKLRGDLSAQAARLGLGERVRFLGWVPEAARRVLPACDVFVQSSLWEAMSVAVLEAMAASKPVVVTTAGDNAHVVENERTGLTVPIGDAGALAAALTRLIDTPALRAELGERARQRFLEEFTVAHMVRRYEQLFSELCTNRVRLTA
jgi:glycosyltransferase involved in cell wall biosynthesis